MGQRMKGDSPPDIRIDALRVCIGGRDVLCGIDLSLRKGEVMVVVGPSGSGKTTLLRAVNRLNESFPDCTTRGSVRMKLGDRIVDLYQDDLPLPEIRRRVGMVFQTPAILPFSIEKNIRLPLRVALGLKPQEIERRMEHALLDVGLWDEVKDRLKSPARMLSGGQQQRLCLARTIALDPEVLLLDEPTASLDFRAAARIEQWMVDHRDRYTILAVSHSLGQTRRIADRVCVLKDGRIVETFGRDRMADVEDFYARMEALF